MTLVTNRGDAEMALRDSPRSMLNRDFEPLRAAVHSVLLRPHGHEWTVQGLGMLRCNPFGGSIFRVNVWCEKFVRAKVSETHDHPWHFTSWILSGQMNNQRFYEMPGGDEYEFRTINCGVDTGDGHVDVTHLEKLPLEVYYPRDVYAQQANEIHSTSFTDGTVTLNKRERINDQRARIFWPKGTEWIDAGPRVASRGEIEFGCMKALQGWIA